MSNFKKLNIICPILPFFGVGQNFEKNGHLSRFCPILFRVGQKVSNLMKSLTKTACPTWDKSMGQNAAFCLVPSHPFPLERKRWDRQGWDKVEIIGGLSE